MQLRKVLRVLGSVAGVALLGGCSGGAAIQAYPGERRPPQEVATLRCDGSLRILEIDGRAVETRELEILPGAHRVVFQVAFRAAELGGGFANVENKDMRRHCIADAKFIAERGAAYRLKKLSKKKGKTFSAKYQAILFEHEFGVLLVDESIGELLPDAVSQMNCG